MVLNTYIRIEEISKISNLNVYLMKLEKQEKNKSQVSWKKKKIIRITEETNEIVKKEINGGGASN